MKAERDAVLRRVESSGSAVGVCMRHGTFELLMYRPQRVDLQSPHDRDELYVVAVGQAEFVRDGEKTTVRAGDVLFVPAGVSHRFRSFSEDFAVWAVFYGPIGGEAKQASTMT